MKDFKTVEEDELAITQEDIDEALERLESYYRNLLNPSGKLPIRKRSRSRKVRDNGKYMILRTEPDPNSPFDQIREGKPIKIKTIFHAVELEIKDKFGGTFICEYHIRDTIKTITDGLAKAYPPVTKSDLEELAKQGNKSYEETKKLLAFSFAQNIFDIRTAVAKFFHDQLEPTLKIVLQDLIMDAELIGMEKYGYKLARASDYEKVQKFYSQMRKQRITILKGKGRPAGSLSLDETEFKHIIEEIFQLFREIRNKNQRITKHAVARKLFPQNSNPLQKLNRFLKRYEITFEQIIDDYEKQKI